MKEILYRAQNVFDDKWVEGFPWTNDFISDITNKTEWYIHDITQLDSIEVYPETICEYSGLTDILGKKIFDGDIIKNRDGELFLVEKDIAAFIFRKVYNNGYELGGGFYLLSSIADYEVIGNKWDNPELIGEDKE